MGELLGPAFVKGVYAIFKGRPNQAFITVVVITFIVLGLWVMNADNPDDRTYGVIAIIFVFLATLGRIFNIMVQERTREIQVEEEEPAEEETAELPATAPSELPVLAQEISPPAANPSVKKTFSYYGLSGEELLRAGLISIFLFVIGYFSCLLLGSRALLLALENHYKLFQGMTDIFSKNLIVVFILNLTIGLAGALFLFSPILVGLGLLLGFLFKRKPVIGKAILAITAFLFGILMFLPLHFFVLLIAAMGSGGSTQP